MNPEELKSKSVAALSLAEKLTRRLAQITTDQGDREAAQDALSNIRAAAEILAEWYGTEPQ